jgi:NADH-quinone oxidoreductase subunit M
MNIVIPLLILVPLVGGIVLLMAGRRAKDLVPLGVAASVVTLILSLLLMFEVRKPDSDLGIAGAGKASIKMTGSGIDPRIEFAPESFRFTLPISSGNHPLEWQWRFGADGISALMVLLTGIVGCITIVLATRQVQNRLAQYIGLLLVTISMLMGVFLAMDLVSFYVFFEAVLIPLILLIHGWGNGENPGPAAKKFLLFTLAGSIPMVIGLIALAMSPVNPQSGGLSQPSTISLPELSQYAFETISTSTSAVASNQSTWILFLLMLGFGIKLAILPLHTWLPTTYVAAHPNSTALIASVVAKLGLYGIVRIVMPMVPVALADHLQMVFGVLGAIAIVYGALCALAQTEMRSILAYSSISHVGFITVGLMSMTAEGVGGATLQMFNHGIITASMFWILAMLEQRRGRIHLTTEERGLAGQYPKLSVLLIFFTLAGAGLPGLNGFVGEVLAMSGMMRVCGTIVAISVLGTLLGAWYGLRIVQRLLFGGEAVASDHGGHHSHGGHHGSEVSRGIHHHHAGRDDDLVPVEWLPLSAVALICIWIGVFPQQTMSVFQPDTDRLTNLIEPVSKRVHTDMDTLASDRSLKPSSDVVATR